MITTGTNECESKNAINNYCFKTIFSFVFVVIFSDCFEHVVLVSLYAFFSQNRAHEILNGIFHLSYIIYAYMFGGGS